MFRLMNLRKRPHGVHGRSDADRGSRPARAEVTPELVTWGYRLFLDREPENRQVVEEKVSRIATVTDMMREFLSSTEFKGKNLNDRHPTLAGDEPPMCIEEVDAAQDLSILLDHIQRTWQHLGETEPHWSVITSERFHQSRIQETKDEFYNSGRQHVDLLFRTMERNGIDYTAFRSCLEYGCGLGRVTRWLAERFENVYGYDISRAHLQSAENHLAECGVRNVTLRHIRNVEDIFHLQESDLIYSLIVLQHNPPPVIRIIVREFLRVLNPGGVAFFQVPTYRMGYSFDARRLPEQRGGRSQDDGDACAPPARDI